MSDFLMVMTTTDSSGDANELAKSIIEARLGACVQTVGPIESTYWWEGTIETEQEWLCLVKTRAEFYPRLAAHIEANHSYETPEITAIPIVEGSRDYLGWVTAETKHSATEDT